jgi:uncharacterized HAD superfamily protein/hypoxanthine phosphoribosyltransferase
MRYRSISDMSGTIARNLHLIPRDIDLVVGVPRSGILPAIMISLMLNLRYADLDSFVEGRVAGAGSTKRHAGLINDPSQARHVLVIDDSLNRGHAMQEVRQRLSAISDTVKITYAAIYVVPDARHEVDIYFEAVPLPRLFEWNFAHHTYLNHACVNIDGVLCPDLVDAENDDGPNYERFLTDALPLHRPTQRIACIATSRLEKYRPQTEAWLKRHGIAYDKLVMLDLPSMEERRRLGCHGQFKGKVYRDSDAIIFIESEHAQAIEIAKIAGKPVLSLEGQQIVSPAALSSVAAVQRLRNFSVHARMSESPLASKEALKRKLQRVLPHSVYGTIKRMAALGSPMKAGD